MAGPTLTPEPGERLGRYQLLQPLGEGGMAKVFIALKDNAHEVCVLKQLHLQLEGQNEAVVRFTREAHIASLLRHRNIATITDAGIEGEKFCIAMEYIAGETVEAMVRAARKQGGVLPFEVTVPIILSALDGLHYAHELASPDGKALKLVHRDLSPRNVMLSYAGETKLIDFGIAKGEVDEYKTAIGSLMGTPYYMSPEQARAVAVDRRSDVYTLGAVLFEMLSGRRLVQAKGRAKILMTVAREKAPPVTKLNPAVPPELEAVLFKALEKNPDDRYPTAKAFADALKDAVGHLTHTPEAQLGMFIQELFPQGKAKAQEIVALGQRANVGPPIEATRVATTDEDGELVVPSALSPGGTSERTRTGFVDATAMTPQDVGLPTRTGYVAAPHGTPDATPMPLAEPSAAPVFDPASTHPSAHYPSQTYADSHDALVSRSSMTHATRTSPVQKIGVGFTLLLLCIVGYVAYGHLTAPVGISSAPPPPTPAVGVATAKPTPTAAPNPVLVESEPPSVRRAPPPPPPPRRTKAPPPAKRTKATPTKTAPPPPPPPRAKDPSGLEGALASLKRSRAKTDAVALNRRVQRAVDKLPEGRDKDAAQRELDRFAMTNEINAMIDALSGAISVLRR